MKYKTFVLTLAFVISFPGYAQNGLIKMKSTFDVATTADRLEAALTSKGMTLFARIDHAAAAKQAGILLRPTTLLIFGNPKVGSPLMVCAQSVAIDLPQKALISQDESGTVWLRYNDPSYLASRHHISGCNDVLQKIGTALSAFANAATQP
ncbi:DUF302 domain-containing protein [Photobacterium galatheae]|uniref:Membrane protein n=1 Tax=Photobacterium galatheae TaxID=1654360 RepID=A0A066RR90_9GAMM|nr:DUF302 domain-containing protein [Photobacterium galatheae]KDM91626.1 membrane protein [Photobacterium galatheae]MCM0149700.1 DUF302 domain-containing protein [Photobacterium galatheae]